ncbi:MAG: sensor histidine kinase [Pseudomonadota bacterium]
MQAIDRVEAATEADELAYVLSHDLRASARALKELPAWIREDLKESAIELPEDINGHVDLLVRHADRLDRMLLDLLKYSRVGRKEPATIIDVASLLPNALLKMQIAPPKDVQIEGNIEGRLNIAPCEAADLIHILVDNALMHGGDTIRLSCETTESHVELRVCDDGPGIPEHKVEAVFLPLQTSMRRDEAEGTGMGLAIANKIVTQASGQIFVSQTGTQFAVIVRFPCASRMACAHH